jgi:hypothetical protein
MIAWCLCLLLAPLLALQPAQPRLGTDSAASISSRLASDSVVRPQHASIVARAAHRDRSSGDNDTGPDPFSAAAAQWLAGCDAHYSGPVLLAIAPPCDFLSRRTAHPRAPPA